MVLFYLDRTCVKLVFRHKVKDIQKISGPWLHAIDYVLNKNQNSHYESIFEKQFFDLNQHKNMSLDDFVEILCDNFTKYQRFTDDKQYQIIPREKQKLFLKKIVRSEECFHFSEVGSGKTKVILPLLCQLFLSNNKEAHSHFSRGGKQKHTLVVLVPEHLVTDARTQVFKYCLNLNFRDNYRVYDDIFALLHENCQFNSSRGGKQKKIFVTSFNSFKKALTYDSISRKVWPEREKILVVTDEVDDFLDRDKLVFNICSNKGNNFDRPTLELYYEVSSSVYNGSQQKETDVTTDVVMDLEKDSNGNTSSSSTSSTPSVPSVSSVLPSSSSSSFVPWSASSPDVVKESRNPNYWIQLHDKFHAIHNEIQDISKSINKSFGIFNERTLRHCSTNVAHDVEGYKSLIARPYESVNRAMPGSYYSDVERTIYLTYVILTEDIGKYDELFQQERKFISFEYWSAHVSQLDYDDL